MRQWSNIHNFNNLNACAMHSTDSRLTAISGTLHISLHLAQAQIVGCLSTILSSHLSSIGSVLLGTTETHLSC